MKKNRARIIMAFLVLAPILAMISGAIFSTVRADNSVESDAIKQAVAQYMRAVNSHDGTAVGMAFSEDADFTDGFGVVFHGRKGIADGFTSLFATRLNTAHWEIKVRSIRFLSPDVAAVDNDWVSSGSKTPDGVDRPNHTGVHIWTMTKQNGKWLITVFHNQSTTS